MPNKKGKIKKMFSLAENYKLQKNTTACKFNYGRHRRSKNKQNQVIGFPENGYID